MYGEELDEELKTWKMKVIVTMNHQKKAKQNGK